MSQIVATKKADLITLPRSDQGLVGPVGTVATVINLRAIGQQRFSANSEPGLFPGLADTYGTIFADGADLGLLSGTTLDQVTGAVTSIAVTAGGSGYTSAPTVSFTASTLVGSFTITAGGSGYTSAPVVTMTGGGGSGAAAVAVIDMASGTVTRLTIAQMGAGYISGAPTVTISGGGGSGATATAVLATPVATAYVSAGQVVSISIGSTTAPAVAAGAGYGSAGAAVVTITGGGGSGATATATVVVGAPSLTVNGCGAGDPDSAPGICQRLPASSVADFFARANKDLWLGVVGSAAGTIRVFRTSY